jgi:LmbE family N-acetylglucosaminyl deacetylase
LCATPVDEVAERIAAVLAEERADVVTVYDANGGYGHRDHARIHDAGRRAAALAGTPTVLQATLPRETVRRAVRLLNAVGVRPGGMTAERAAGWYVPSADITHVIDVRPWVELKRQALAAHASQASGGGDIRTVRLLSRLPRPVARRVLGREWYAECGAPATSSRPRHRQNDLFAAMTQR